MHQDHREIQVTGRREILEVGEVAQAVGNEMSPVPLHSAKHVGAAGDHQPGAVIDGSVGERVRIAPVFSHVGLGLARHVIRLLAFGSGVHVHDHHVRQLLGLRDQPGRRW